MSAYIWRVEGSVVRGDGRGRELGFPTANLDTQDALPPAGVYAAWVRVVQSCDPVHVMSGGVWHEATVSVGNNPTFGDVDIARAECFLHDFSGDLYGCRLEVMFVAYIRGMAAFSEIDELVAQSAIDVGRSRSVLQEFAPQTEGAAEAEIEANGEGSWLIFLDIDGTLVDDTHRPRASTVRAVQQARARGHRVYLSTGRSRSSISDEIIGIGFDGVVSASGGFIEVAGSLVDTQTMDEGDVAYLIDLFAEHGLEYTLQSQERSYSSRGLADRMRPLLIEQRELAAGEPSALAHLEQLERRFVYDGPPPLAGIAKATFVGPHDRAFHALKEEIDPRFFAITGTIPYLGTLGGEVGLRETNKGNALHRIARHHGIPMVRTMAVGDSANDLEMVVEAAAGVVMGDGAPELREVADFVTGTVADDGIWQAFLQYRLVAE